jgi:hypothetical protein
MYVPTPPIVNTNRILYLRSKMEIAEWERFFTEFDPVSFPNLREMKVEYCEWPTTE